VVLERSSASSVIIFIDAIDATKLHKIYLHLGLIVKTFFSLVPALCIATEFRDG
jgi:hypothetical protein